PEEENLLQEQKLKMIELKQKLGQALTPEEQECLRQHNQLKDTAS
ncbi:replication protein, partial [Priestia aryabhattai]|nr:replication protein [Priestia aryabhattai]